MLRQAQLELVAQALRLVLVGGVGERLPQAGLEVLEMGLLDRDLGANAPSIVIVAVRHTFQGLQYGFGTGIVPH